MSSSDEEEEGDNLSEIDFSVISTSIKLGGTVVNQIVNSINYGSPEVRYLLQEECDVIIECKLCRNLFRSIPMFVAHKRIYCQNFSASSKEIVANSQPQEEVVVVQPQSADVPVESEGQPNQSTVDQLLAGTFHGTSEAYRLYTKYAQKVETQKANKTFSTINLTEIPTNPNAVQISVQRNAVNQSDNVLQNDIASDNRSIQIKRSSDICANRSELMKELNKTTEKSPENLKDKLGKTEGILNSDSKKGKGLGKNIDLRPVKSQESTVCELTELENMGHCDIKKIRCLICKVTFVKKKGLLQHMHSQHSGRKTVYPCHMCSSKFKYFWGLTRHLKISHEKTKDQIDKMRGKLRANAYTVTVESGLSESAETNEKEDKSVSSQTEAMAVPLSSNNSEVTKKVMRNSGGITLNKCGGCGKAFWKRQSYDEHTSQCKWLASASHSNADNLKNKNAKKNDKNMVNKDTSISGEKEDKNELKIGEKNKKELPVLADSQDSPKTVPERFIRTRSESKTRSNETKTRSGSNESRNSSRNEKFIQENRSRSENTKDVMKNSVRKERRDSSNDGTSRNEKFTQENRSRGGNNRDVENINKDQTAEITRSEIRGRSDISRTSSGDRSDSSRSVSRDRKGSLSSDVTEKQMVTRNIATRRGECERKPTSSKTTIEKSSNKSRKSDESIQDSDSETMSKNLASTNNVSRRIATRRSNVSTTVENDEVDGSSKKESTSPSCSIYCEQNFEDGSKEAKEVNSDEASRKYMSTRSSDAQKNKDLQNQISSRNSSVERDQVSGTRKSISTRSSDDASSKINVGTMKNSDSDCLEPSDAQTFNEPSSEITSTGNTYIIDGVEISEVTEAQINSRKTLVNNKIDETGHQDVLDELISDTAPESKHYLRSLQKETTKVCNTETRLSCSSENFYLDSGTATSDKTERSSSSERRSRTLVASSQKQSPSLKSSGVEKKKMDADVKHKFHNEEVVAKDTPVSTVRHVLRSHEKIDTAKNKDVKQALSSNTLIDHSLFDPSNEMLEAQETINSLQNFPDLQMITRHSLETFRPKDEKCSEETSDEVLAPVMITRKSERQKALAVDENKNQESVVDESHKPAAPSKKSAKDESTLTTIYVCIYCPKEFSYYWGLTRHLRINHHKSKQQIPLLWNKLKAKSYAINKKTAVKKINKTGPMKVESGNMNLRLRQSKKNNKKSKSVSSVKTRDNRHTRSQQKMQEVEPKSVEKISPNTRKSMVKTGENSSVVGNQTAKISPKAESLKSQAPGVKTDFKMHEGDQGTHYNTRKSLDHFASSKDTPPDIGLNDESRSEKLYSGPEINSNSNKVCIEEIWVGKEPGQPSKSIRCQKVIIESESGKSLLSKMTVRRRKSQLNSPKLKEKGTRKMYVVDPGKSSQPRCLDSKRVDALICENHTTAEQYCLQCGMVFSNVSNLRRHIVRHLGWKRYKCKLCSFASYNKSECSTHLRRIHTEKLLGGSVQSYVIDLNKEASKLRTEKKQNTMSLRKTDTTMPGTTSCKSYWYRDRNTKRVPLKIANSIRGEVDPGCSENATDSSKKKKKASQKKNEDRKKPGVNVKNIKQISSSSKYNISTRNSTRTFDTSPYKEMNEMETLMTRQGHYPKDEKISLRPKRDILSDMDNENVLPKQISKSNPSSQEENDSVISNANSGSDSVVLDKPVVRKRKRSDSEGNSSNKLEDGNDNEIEGANKTSPSGSKSKTIQQNEEKWKLKRSFSHDGIPSSQVCNEESVECSSDTDGVHSSNMDKKNSKLRQVETDVRLAPSLKTMMAALEEARATVKKRGRTLKRSISPVKKIQRLSSVDASKDRFRRHSLDITVSKTGTSTTEEDINLDTESVDENVDDEVKNINQLSADNEVTDSSKIENDENKEDNLGKTISSAVSDSSHATEKENAEKNTS